MADAAAKRRIMAAPSHEKKLVIERVPDSGLYQIKYTGGGNVPSFLNGSYTSEQFARKALDRWLAQKPR